MTIEDLKINPTFRDLIPKLTQSEYAQLEKNILEDGTVKEPLIVWNQYIIDGHHRYYIIKDHPELPYEIEEKEFTNEHAAMAWACANQLGRRNLEGFDREYLIGKQQEEEKLSQGGTGANRHTANLQTSKASTSVEKVAGTAQRIAEENGIDRSSVYHYQQFAKGVDITDEIIPGMKEQILHRDIKVPKIVVENMSSAAPEKQKKAALAISERDIKTAKEILKKEKPSIVNIDPEPYNINDMIEEVKAAGSELHFALNQTLIVMHQDVLTDQKSKNNIVKCLQDILTDVQDFITKISER